MTYQVPQRPISQKPERQGKDPAYLAKVRALPCVICQSFGEIQMSPTTAHHPRDDWHSRAKRPDRTAIPLCDGHHQGTFDTSKIAYHRDRAEWRDLYGKDTDYIAVTQDRIARDAE